MTTLAFDSLRYARRLREAGVPEPQADVQAELMAEAFGFYADNILTKDHFEAVLDAKLDARFAKYGARFEKRFSDIDRQFSEIDRRFSEQEAKFDQRFADIDRRFSEQDAKLDKRFAEQDAKFEGRFSKLERASFLHTWMLGILVVVIVIPQLQAWLV